MNESMSLSQSFLTAMEDANNRNALLATSSSPMTAMDLWGLSIPEILNVVIAKAKELGREYRAQIEDAAQGAVDALVALDLPWVPASIEGLIDDATKQLGYAAIKSILDAILAE